MEKILLAINAVKPDKKALDFACFLGRLTGSKVTGVFLENIVAEEKLVLDTMYGKTYVDWRVDEKSEQHLAKMALIEKNILLFKEGCTNREVSYSVYRDEGVPASELLTETRFADILVTDTETSFSKAFDEKPGEFIKDILRKSECPVVIAPENFLAIDEIVFTYDGSASSVFAMKQFTYLFPEFHNKLITILQVNETGKWSDPDTIKFRDWLQDHYTNLHFEALKGRSEKVLFEHLYQKKNMFIILGAFGRNVLSQKLHHSFAESMIGAMSQAIFIAHP